MPKALILLGFTRILINDMLGKIKTKGRKEMND